MILLKLALRNLLGAGLRTALNVSVLSLTFVAIVATLGLLAGLDHQASRAMIDAEYGGGQSWHPGFDPQDTLTLSGAHAPVPEALGALVAAGRATAILAVQATLYPEGRVRPVVVKGIDPAQAVLGLPTRGLGAAEADEAIPALIGTRMAKSAGLGVGDTVTVQWRDAEGTLDARDLRVVEVMSTTVQGVDRGQVWVPLDRLRELARMPGEATLVVLARGEASPPDAGGWGFRSPDVLLADVHALVQGKAIGSAFVHLLLVFLAMLALFDTQTLSVFRRRREIGTLVALGMTRERVMALFTLEGALHGVLAGVVALAWGGPLLAWFARKGWGLSAMADSYGFAVGDRIYPTYSPTLVLGTAAFLLLVTTVVSWLPARRIASLPPTEALRGRL
jgi:ABC-type lipoprotein release transport system permease subunit